MYKAEGTMGMTMGMIGGIETASFYHDGRLVGVNSNNIGMGFGIISALANIMGKCVSDENKII